MNDKIYDQRFGGIRELRLENISAIDDQKQLLHNVRFDRFCNKCAPIFLANVQRNIITS